MTEKQAKMGEKQEYMAETNKKWQKTFKMWSIFTQLSSKLPFFVLPS